MMLRNLLRIAPALVALVPLWQLGPAGESEAYAGNLFHRDRDANIVYSSQMFSNYYAGPSFWSGGTPAQLYVAPLPTPPLVGHTYITYEPLRPHEMMYRHRRSYFRHNSREGWSHTRVRYR